MEDRFKGEILCSYFRNSKNNKVFEATVGTEKRIRNNYKGRIHSNRQSVRWEKRESGEKNGFIDN